MRLRGDTVFTADYLEDSMLSTAHMSLAKNYSCFYEMRMKRGTRRGIVAELRRWLRSTFKKTLPPSVLRKHVCEKSAAIQCDLHDRISKCSLLACGRLQEQNLRCSRMWSWLPYSLEIHAWSLQVVLSTWATAHQPCPSQISYPQ
jgi:hypothetical protein